jgi:CBS domain-containing protein
MVGDKQGIPVVNMMNGVLLHADQNENLLFLTQLLVENNAHAVLIRDQGSPIGIVTAKDILRSLINLGGDPTKIIAKDAMSSPLIAVDYDQDVTSARELMLDHGVRKLPVKKDMDVIGLLVQEDLIKDLRWSVGLL